MMYFDYLSHYSKIIKENEQFDDDDGDGYTVYVGEVGNEQGNYVGFSKTLRGARALATKERNEYYGDGWSMIRGVGSFGPYEEIKGRTRY